MTQMRIPAVYMRGGTSKGVFFRAEDLPADPAERDRVLLRVTGSPDPYGKQIDGMGAATSSTSKVAILARSSRPDCDVDYLFGQVAIDRPVIDWSGNCGNLTGAVGPFAIAEGLADAPRDGMAVVRIWQANVGKRIVAHVPVRDGEVVEEGGFRLDGVTFPAAEIVLEYLDPGGGNAEGEGGAMFPTGRVIDRIEVPGLGSLDATFINAGNPTIFVEARAMGLLGTELQEAVNGDAAILARCEAVRAHGAVAMGLASSAEDATRNRQATPKLAFVSPPQATQQGGAGMVTKAVMSRSARRLMEGWVRVPPPEMAPTGVLRIGVNLGNPVIAQKDPAGGEPKGVGPARAADIDFAPAYVHIEGTYLVREDAPWRGVAELDREGARIGVGLKTAYDLFLTREIARAELVRGPSSGAAIEAFVAQGLDAAAGVRQPLAAWWAASHPGYRVLDESFMVIRQAAGVPKGRPAAAAYLAAFIEEAKRSGFVAQALQESGVGDVTIAPPQT